MADVRTTMLRAFADAAALGPDWALVGGLAVSARVEPRLTRDVDLAFAVHGDAAAEQVVRDLLGRGYEMVAGIEHRATGRLATDVAVATLPDLIAMKVLARDDRRRPQDYDDLVALIAEASSSELGQADEALDLIATRGYGRGKELRDELRSLVRDLGRR